MTTNPNDFSNPQSQNRLNNNNLYPAFSNDPRNPQQPFQPNQQPYPNQPPNYPNQAPGPVSPRQNQEMVVTMCPSCNSMTPSYVKKDIGMITWAWCFGLWIFTGVCCWIPFFCDDCKEQQVRCGKCHFKKAVV